MPQPGKVRQSKREFGFEMVEHLARVGTVFRQIGPILPNANLDSQTLERGGDGNKGVAVVYRQWRFSRLAAISSQIAATSRAPSATAAARRWLEVPAALVSTALESCRSSAADFLKSGSCIGRPSLAGRR